MSEKLLIKGGYILSMDPNVGELERGAVLVEDGRIAAIAPARSTRCMILPPSRLPSMLVSFGSASSEYSDFDSRTYRPSVTIPLPFSAGKPQHTLSPAAPEGLLSPAVPLTATCPLPPDDDRAPLTMPLQ